MWNPAENLWHIITRSAISCFICFICLKGLNAWWISTFLTSALICEAFSGLLQYTVYAFITGLRASNYNYFFTCPSIAKSYWPVFNLSFTSVSPPHFSTLAHYHLSLTRLLNILCVLSASNSTTHQMAPHYFLNSIIPPFKFLITHCLQSNIQTNIPGWNSWAFPSDSNTHQIPLPLTPDTTHLQPHWVVHLSGIKPPCFHLSSSLYLKWLTLIFHQANSLFFKAPLKYYFSKAIRPPRNHHSLLFPTFPILNIYRSFTIIWFASCKFLLHHGSKHL